MRWFARRLVFYAFAIWVALTINFLLPRLMPGSPIAGLLQHLTPSQLSANPGLIQTYQALLGGGNHSIWQDYVTYLHRIAHFDFGISTSNYPTPVSEVIGRTLPYSIFLVGVAFALSFVVGITVGMVAAWRRGGVVDNFVVPTFLALGAFPAFFIALLSLYFLGLKLHWFPIQHAYDVGVTPGLNWAFLSSALRHAELPILVIGVAYAGGWVLNMRTVMINTISEDYVALAHAKGLPDRRVMTRYAGRNAILPPLNGFAPLFASAVGGLVFVEYVFSYPGAGLTLQQAVLGIDYPLAQALLVVLSVCVILANLTTRVVPTTAAPPAEPPVGERAVVRAEQLTKRFGNVLAVDDLSFVLERGTVTGFLGPNGAGKTTTLRMLLHLVEPTAGRALVFGGRYQDLTRPASRVGAVLEAADFHPGRSARDHLVALALALGRELEDGNWFLGRERAAAKRVDAALDLVELTAAADRRVGSYSLGMRQRLGLAGALLGDPELLILDEPANGLDPEGVRWLRDFMRSFAAVGKTVLVSSHVLSEVQQTVDQVVIINKGRLVNFSPLADLTARLTGTVRVRTPGAQRLQTTLAAEGIRSTLLDGDELLVAGAPSAQIGELAFTAGIPLHVLVPESSSLEDVFLELTAKEPS